ncbi:MAG: hypothetical protein COB15_03855 [Flavobacteriales bacterium]|nr:MAG: hypothetical protein COB15_03855 [Flavobacteriales bacterium]
MKKLKIGVVLLFFMQTLFAQNNLNPIQRMYVGSEYWSMLSESDITNVVDRQIIPNKYKLAKLDINKLKSDLSSAVYRTVGNNNQGIEIELPNPQGILSKYLVYKNTTMAPGLEVKFPEIRAYDVININNPSEYGKIDVTPHGFHAMIFSIDRGTFFIDPYSKGNTADYLSYYRKDFTTTKTIDCGVVGQTTSTNNSAQKTLTSCDLRTYRLAVSATAEYTAFHGGTLLLAQAAQVTSMNRVNGIFERDAQITMTLIANNDLIVYTSNPDPFTNGNTNAMINENQTNTDLVIGSGNYDIGHIFGTNSGGLAALQSPCSGSKARGVTGSSAPVNDPFDVDYVAHEMGHQWGGNHTQNNSCNRNNATAMEPGSASSIMGYAGICTPNVQSNSDDHFHGVSVKEMSDFISGGGGSCAVLTPVTNSSPTITGTPGSVTIPANTPFALTAIATDPNAANVLSYCWEQMDNQISTQPPSATSTNGPNFRSNSPTTSPTRYFPNLTDLTAGISPTWEVLSSVSRTMDFRVTVRDNAGPLPEVGCIDNADITVTIDASSGPFVETFPSAAGITWTGSTSETVTWSEAGTSGAPVNCANVDILLSTDGGITYPTVLVSNTVNDGTQSITVPNTPSTTARVMIMSSNGTFFDISDNDFTITAAAPPAAAVGCIDTIYYPESKRTAYDGWAYLEANVFGITGISQTFEASTGSIHGIRAFVVLDTNTTSGDVGPVDMQISVMNVDAFNQPVLPAIRTELVTVNDIGDVEQNLMFSTPVAVSSKYAVVVELNPATQATDTAFYMANSSAASDGAGEGLMSVSFSGFWFNYWLQSASYNVDALLSPIFDKIITADFTSSSDTICEGDTVQFINTSVLDTNYMYNRYSLLNADLWVWDYDDGSGTYNHFDTTYTFNVAGPHNTELIITNYGYTTNCVDTLRDTIEVLAPPIVVANNNTALCMGDTLFLSATGATSYVWDNGLGAGQNHTVVPTIDTMYIVTGSNGGCSAMDTVSVTTNALPVVGVSNDTIICAGDTVTVSATGGGNYTWDNGLGAGQNHQVAPVVLTTYIVTVTDTNFCSGIDSVKVTTNALPVLTTTPAIDTTVCLGDSLTLFVTGASSYTWDNGLGAGSTHLLPVPYDTTYKVIGIDAITGCSNIDSVKVIVSSLDVIASNDTSICIGSSITISATGAVTYTWDNALGIGQSHLVSPTEQTVYIVTGDDNGCIGLDTVIVSIDNICFDIPNVFTPNGDGKNDVWNIKGLAFYPDITVSVFNRWGDLVFESAAGYPDPWDGTYNGTESPSATYYYVIVKGDGEEGVTGTVNIIR